MKFIKKKNMQAGEELLYIPQLHWMFTVRHMVLSIPFFLILLIISTASPAAFLTESFGIESTLILRAIIKRVFLASILVVLLIFVWRIFQYLNTEYGVTNKRLIMKKGVLRLFVTEIPTDRIESIHCYQGLFGRLFRYGTLSISGIGGKMPMFKMVHRPYALRRKVVDIIERNKAITVIHGEMPKVKPPARPEKPEPIEKEEPIYRYGTFVKVLSPGK